MSNYYRATLSQAQIRTMLAAPKPRPLCPWDTDEGARMFQQSMTDGHRVGWFKCRQCSLEYQIRTWREGDDIARHFPHCPECGSANQSNLLKIDHEIGPIWQAMSD